jgi:hypothetical protein
MARYEIYGYGGKFNYGGTADAIIMACLFAISFYNFIELNFILLTVFQQKKGLYFWSFVVSTWGIALFCIGFTLKVFALTLTPYVSATFTLVGWSAMVNGQSLVLYSRMHLIVYNRHVLHAMLAMIVADFIILNPPIWAVLYGSIGPNSAKYSRLYSVFEKVQVSMYFLQETVLSVLYIVETVRFLRATSITGYDANRKLMKHLLLMSALVCLLDLPTLALEYASLYHFQTSYKPLAYSVKLKLEFSILNKLVQVAWDRRTTPLGRDLGPEIPSFQVEEHHQ